jgi:DnaJ-class molecular chaperone
MKSINQLCKLLNVDEHTPIDDIKKQYRILARLHHPDRESGNADAFKEISAAYEILIDPEKRSKLQRSQSVETNDMIKSKRTEYSRPHVTVTLNLTDVMHGCYKQVSTKCKVTCERCAGTGIAGHKTNVIECRECFGKGVNPIFPAQACVSCNGQGIFVINHTPCGSCNGKKTIEQTIDRDVYIPPGTKMGEMIVHVDMLIHIQHSLPESVRIREMNIHVKHSISIKELVFGFQHELSVGHTIYCLKGSHAFDIKKPLKIKGHGINEIGDIFVEFELHYVEDESLSMQQLAKAVRKLNFFKDDTIKMSTDSNAHVFDVHHNS